MSKVSLFARLPVELIAIILELASSEQASGDQPSGRALLNLFQIDSRLRIIASQRPRIWHDITTIVLLRQPVKRFPQPRQLLQMCLKGNPKVLQQVTLSSGWCMRRIHTLYQHINHLGGTVERLHLPRICYVEGYPACRCELCQDQEREQHPLELALQLVQGLSTSLRDLQLRFHGVQRRHHTAQLARWAELDGLAQPETLSIIIDWSSHAPAPLRSVCLKLTSRVKHLTLESFYNVNRPGDRGRVGFFTEVAASAAPTVQSLAMELQAQEIGAAPLVATFPCLESLSVYVWNGYDLEQGAPSPANRGMMPTLRALEVPAALLDSFYAPSIETAVLRLYQDFELPCVLRSLQEWKSLRHLRLHAHSKALFRSVIGVLQGLVRSINQCWGCSSIECLVLTYRHEDDDEDHPLGIVTSSDGLDRLAQRSINGRVYSSKDLHIVNEWGETYGMEVHLKDLLKAHRAPVRAAHLRKRACDSQSARPSKSLRQTRRPQRLLHGSIALSSRRTSARPFQADLHESPSQHSCFILK